MTILFGDDFHLGNLTLWTAQNLGPACTYAASTDVRHHDGYSGKGVSSAANRAAETYKQLAAAQPALYWRAYCLTAGPTAANLFSCLSLANATGVISVVYLFNNAPMRIAVRNQVTGTNYNTVAFPNWAANKWFCVELYTLVSDTVGIINVWIDGALMYNVTGVDTNNGANILYLNAGVNSTRVSEAATVYNDCCVASDRYIGTEFQQYGRSRFTKGNRNTQFVRNDPNPYYPQYPPRPR